MRPDLEDFDELSTGDGSTRSRAMSWLVLCVAVGGFGALAYYAYHSGSQSMRDSTLTVVNADDAPIKSEPVDRQGEQFPNKDKTIYDAIAQDGDKSGKVEKLLPEAEAPVMPSKAEMQPVKPSVQEVKKEAAEVKKEATTTTFVNAANKPVHELGDGKPVEVKPVETKQAEIKIETKPPVATPIAPLKTANAAPVEAIDAEDSDEAPSAAAPAMVNVKPVNSASQPTSELKDAKAKAAATIAKSVDTKPAAKAASGGAAKVQLGAFKSEAEATAQWKKISSKNSDVLSGSPIIVKAELPNGTFYRLRAAVDDAKAACAKLAARKQACFPAGK